MRERIVLSNLRKLARRNLESHPQMVVFAHDLVSHEIAARGLYEADLLHSIFSSPGFNTDIYNGACLDIGANIGNHSVFFAREFSEVLAFEPNPLTAQLLQINVRAWPNVRTLQFGLSTQTGDALLQPGTFNVGGSKIVSQNTGDCMPIRLERLDTVIDTLEIPVTFIKLDVEGHECDALKGGEVTINEALPIILFEQHAKDFQNGTSPTIELLKSWGYQFFTRDDNGSPIFRPRPSRKWHREMSFVEKYYPGILAAHPMGHKIWTDDEH
ncbi:FkbM family methyltransferase [Roseobacter sp. HKCCA2468]|uniref:FkbM family methyltransferase n=1 Tax=Roseobacter sp. HKCCA2468 TaxID=3120342 RepID=UPI0030ECB1A8